MLLFKHVRCPNCGAKFVRKENDLVHLCRECETLLFLEGRRAYVVESVEIVHDEDAADTPDKPE